VIALAMMAIIFAAILPQFRNIQNSSASKQAGAEAVQNARVVMDFLNRHLTKAVRITAVSEPAETNGYIEFEDNSGAIIRCDIGANNYVQYGNVAQDRFDLAGPVSKLQFTCYSLRDLDTPITNVAFIRLVKVETTLINSAPLGQDKTFTTMAYLRTNRTNTYKFSVTGADATGSITLKKSGKIVGPSNIIDETEILTITEPSMAPSTGHVSYSGGTHTISGDIHCDKFTAKETTLRINGDVTILAEKDVKIHAQSRVELLDGATLTIYIKKKFTVTDETKFNENTADPSRALILGLGSGAIEVSDESTAYLTVIAPQSDYDISDQTSVSGVCQVKDLLVKDQTTLTVDAGSSGQLLESIEEIRP